MSVALNYGDRFLFKIEGETENVCSCESESKVHETYRELCEQYRLGSGTKVRVIDRFGLTGNRIYQVYVVR